MKIILLILVILSFLSPTEELNKSYEIGEYSILIPEKFNTYCDIEISDNKSKLYIRLKDSGDFVAAISIISTDMFEPDLGCKILLSNDNNTVFMSLPTCGTLNDESKRSIWSSLLNECEKITVTPSKP